jgi:hypothetical protein
MGKDRLQTSRFELKYLVNEETALLVREFVRSYLELDENGVGKPNYSYQVHSIYLDSEDLKTYWSTINGDKNRFKLRLRFYNNSPDTPVFFEIKRRMNNCIMKQRGAVHRDAVPLLLSGQLPEPSHLCSKEPKHLLAVQNFCRLIEQISARPKVHIGYLREAYVPHDDNSARVTLDRDIRTEPELVLRLQTEFLQPTVVWDKDIVVELKFTNRFPNWFSELVRIFGLRQCGAAKYVDGVARMGESKLAAIRAVLPPDPLIVHEPILTHSN